MDSMGHVNNVQYVRYAETARVGWVRGFAAKAEAEAGDNAGNRGREREKRKWEDLWTSRSRGMILKRIDTVFKFPLRFPDHVSAFHRVSCFPLGGDASYGENDDQGQGEEEAEAKRNPPQKRFRKLKETLVLDVLLLSHLHTRVAATFREEVTMFDYVRGRKMDALPGFMQRAFENVVEEQEVEIRYWRARREEVERLIEELERGLGEEDVGQG